MGKSMVSSFDFPLNQSIDLYILYLSMVIWGIVDYCFAHIKMILDGWSHHSDFILQSGAP